MYSVAVDVLHLDLELSAANLIGENFLAVIQLLTLHLSNFVQKIKYQPQKYWKDGTLQTINQVSLSIVSN